MGADADDEEEDFKLFESIWVGQQRRMGRSVWYGCPRGKVGRDSRCCFDILKASRMNEWTWRLVFRRRTPEHQKMVAVWVGCLRSRCSVMGGPPRTGLGNITGSRS
jgi:hypothetical protein